MQMKWGAHATVQRVGQVLPAVDLLKGLDKDAGADGRHALPGDVEFRNVLRGRIFWRRISPYRLS